MSVPEDFIELLNKLGFELSSEEQQQVYDRASKAQDPIMMAFGMSFGNIEEQLVQAKARVGTPPFSTRGFARFEVNGTCVPGYEPIRDAFVSNFVRGLERDAQLCIYHRGVCVVDLWGSNKEPTMSVDPEYSGNTLQIVFSSTKVASACVFAVAQDRGLFHYNDRVAKYWPEFAQQGKEAMTIADVLRHDAGLQSFSEALSAEDILNQADPNGRMAQVIAATPVWKWTTGPDKGLTPRIYHAVSRGFILNQILIRVDPKGRTIGQWMVEELCGPISADFFCGHHDPSFPGRQKAEMQMPELPFTLANATIPSIVQRMLPKRYPPSPQLQMQLDMEAMPHFEASPLMDAQGRKNVNMPPSGKVGPSTEYEMPSGSGRASARGMARLMALFANGGQLDGVRVLSEAGVQAAIANPIPAKLRNNEGEMNPSFLRNTAFVQGGWDELTHPYGGTLGAAKHYGTRAYGWGGAGGSSIWFNLVENIGFGYTVTGFGAGFNGDVRRLQPIYAAFKRTPLLCNQGAASKL